MNDFERKLAAQPFREPPADLRRAVLAAAQPAPRSSWREWLWPSPSAWGALAALWLAFFAVEAFDGVVPEPASDLTLADDGPSMSTLLTVHTPRDLRHALNLPN